MADDSVRAATRLQRETFEREHGTISAWVFRDLGSGRTLGKKLAHLRDALWADDASGLYLEIGAGEGTGASSGLHPPRRVALDPAHGALVRARLRAGAAVASSADGQGDTRWVAALGEELPFRDATFDGVYGIDVLHHLAAPTLAFAEIARVLKPGGRLAFVEPNPRFPVNWAFLFSKIERGLFAIRPRNLEGWTAAAGLVGLEVGNVPTFFPSAPASLAAFYEDIEAALARIPVVRSLSTGRSIVATRPFERTRPPSTATLAALDVAAHDLNAALKLPLLDRALARARGPYLDLGSGPGYVTARLLAVRDATVVCVDVDAGNLQALAATLATDPAGSARVALVRADATRLPFRDAVFTTVVASEVLEHVAEDRACAREMARVLVDDGQVVITVPTTCHDHPSLLAALGIDTVHDRPGPEHHVREGYEPAALERLLEAADLEPRERKEWVRHAARVVIDLVGAAHLVVERVSHGRGSWTWSEAVEAARTSLAFRLYRRLFPLLRALTRLDTLFERSPGWQVLVRARRRPRSAAGAIVADEGPRP